MTTNVGVKANTWRHRVSPGVLRHYLLSLTSEGFLTQLGRFFQTLFAFPSAQADEFQSLAALVYTPQSKLISKELYVKDT